MKFKKIISLLTVAVMLYGLESGSIHGLSETNALNTVVSAESASDININSPDMQTFATKAQLIDNEYFSLYNESKESGGMTQKVYFGTSNGEAQSWYIAGGDNNGNELVLLCDPTRPFIEDFAYEENWMKEKEYQSGLEWGDYGENPLKAGDTVSSNHYGASKVRDYLNGDALKKFTDAELDLIVEVPVYTDDLKNEVNFCTTDKLYLGYGCYGDTYFTLGRNSDNDLNSGLKVSLLKNNFSVNSPFETWTKPMFWLRAPYFPNFFMLVATPYHYLINYITLNKLVITPALNMDTSDLLFASMATSTSENAVVSDGMTFRFYNKNKIKSSAKYTENEVSVNKAADDKDLYLYVQYNESGTEKVYSKKLNDSETIKMDNVNLKYAKVWLETANTTDNLVYAKMADSEISKTVVEDEINCVKNENSAVDYLYMLDCIKKKLDALSIDNKYDDIYLSSDNNTVTVVFSDSTYKFNIKWNIKGDANNDNEVNVRDAAAIASALAKGQADTLPAHADFNNDDKVNVRDAAGIASWLANGGKL